MFEAGTIWYFLVVAGGAIVLGVAMVYGMLHNRRITVDEQREAEAGAHELYDKEERNA